MKTYNAESVPWQHLIKPDDFEQAQQHGLITIGNQADLFEMIRTGVPNDCRLNAPKSQHHGISITPVMIQVHDIDGELTLEYMRYQTQILARTVKSIITKQLNGK
jgi:hypothetical protein